MLESQLSVSDSGLSQTKRLLSFDHTFFTTPPGSDLSESIVLNKNSWVEIRSLEVMFNYAQAPAAGFEYFTNSLNFSGSFVFEILDSNTLHNLITLSLPIRHNWSKQFSNFYLDSDTVRSLSFSSSNSNFVSFKEGVLNISSTIEKVNLLFLIEVVDYPKGIYVSDGQVIKLAKQ